MSGIVGILHTDGRTAEPALVHAMLQAVAHRCVDGSAVWQRRQIGLGHACLRAVPESQALPLVDGDLAVTADVRLDNRDELAAELQLSDRSLCDAALILAAYRRWGEEFPAHLLGDFAFALWDGRRELVFCARDHFGVKPFYYHADGAHFVFASEIKALFALPDVSCRVEEARIADFLIGWVADRQSTFYGDVFRLPPHHSLTVTASGSRLRSYWQLDPEARPPAGDLAEQFRDLFTTAVRCRLRSSGPAGAMLSGGLDSSSVACVAAPMVSRERGQPLPTVSLLFDKTPERSERPFIEAVLARGGFDPSYLTGDDCAPFTEIGRILEEQDGPFLAPGLAVSRQLYHAASERGVRVLLDGHGGDEVVSHGHGRLHELALANRWPTLWREARGVAATYGDPAWRVFSAYVERYGPRPVRVAAPLLRGRRKEGHAPRSTGRFLNPDLVRRTGLTDRYRAYGRTEREASKSERTRHASYLAGGLLPHGFEVLDRAAAMAGVEPRYPFWDKRLVEFCLALPSDAKLKDGWSRWILRRAMQDILPAAVQWRRDKLDFAPHLIRGMLEQDRALVERVLLHDAEGIGRYVEVAGVLGAWQRIAAHAGTADGNDVQIVWRTVVLSSWLRRLREERAGTAAAA